MAKSKSKKEGIKVGDLSDVDSGGAVVVPYGDYPVAVDSIEEGEGDAGPYIKWTFRITEDEYKGSRLYYYTSLSEQSKWNLKGLLEILGADIPDENDPRLREDDVRGLEMLATVEVETYNNRKRSKITDFAPKKPEKGKHKKDEPRRGKNEEIELDDIEAADENELAKIVRKHKLDLDLDDHSTLRKKRAAVVEAAQEAEVLVSKKKVAEKDIERMNPTALDELIEEHDLDCDLLDDMSVKEMRAAVIEAAEKAGILAE